MKCAKCGFTTEESVKFCPSCGAPMSSTVSIDVTPPKLVDRATPWRRWSARLFDLWLGIVLFGVLLVCIVPELANAILLSVVCTPLALCLEALEYGLFGGTFGKWVFSVRVLDSKGERIGGAEYAKRLLPVWLVGMGLGLPIVLLITEVIQYNRLKKGLAATYDEKAGRVVVQYKQGFVKLLVCVAFVLIMVWLWSTGNSVE